MKVKLILVKICPFIVLFFMLSPQAHSEVLSDEAGDSFGFGVVGSLAAMYQDDREFKTAGSDIYELSAVKSVAPNYGIFARFENTAGWSLQLAFGRRNTHFKGSTKTIAGSQIISNTDLTQHLIFGSLEARKIVFPAILAWAGFGLEISRGYEVKLLINDVEVPTTEKDHPFFAEAFVSLGKNWKITNNWQAAFSLRLGYVMNTKPAMSNYEPGLEIAYLF